MRLKSELLALFAVLCVSVAVSLNAQESQSATGQSTSAPPEEHRLGAYVAAGSIEAGYRFVDVSGAQFPCVGAGGAATLCNYTGMYDTLVDLRQGPRVFDQTLSLRAVGESGVLFDNLFFSSFGWGGDPDNVARLRLNKNKFYNLNVLFRRDYQRFDYNLLANPLNATNSTPTILQLNSPHVFETVRRMSDVSLTLAPTSPISVRLGLDRLRIEGPSFTTFHMPRGTEIQAEQPNNVTSDTGRAGVDLKLVPRTTLSFDGIVTWFKNDSFPLLNSFPFTVGGVPTNLGISWDVLGRIPCAAPFIGGVVNPTCNQGTFFTRQDRVRTTLPTVMGSLESHYWNKLDLSLRGVYGWGDMDSTFFQDWLGVTGTGRRQTTVQNPHTRRISTSADAGVTFHVSDSFRISDSFRFLNIRIPALADQVVTTFPTGSVLTPLGTPTLAGTGLVRGLFNQIKMNETNFEFDFTRHLGVRVGYRYTHRRIQLNGEAFDIDTNTGERDNPNEPGEGGFDQFKIPEHTAIGGLWFQPSSMFRLMLDAEASSAGITYRTGDIGGTITTTTGLTTFTRITPRHQQQYRARATYQPQQHVSLGATLNITEQRNSLQDIQFRYHNRYYSFNADVSPNDRILLDLAYTYQDYLQNDLICFVASGAPATGAFPGSAVGISGACPLDPTYLGVTGDYANQVHFGSAMLRVKPVKRVTLSAGYSIVSNDGGFTQLNALQPPGLLQFNYHRPLAALEIELAKGLALKGGWNYYGFNEKGSNANLFGSGGPTIPRDFHANTGQVALRYSF